MLDAVSSGEAKSGSDGTIMDRMVVEQAQILRLYVTKQTSKKEGEGATVVYDHGCHAQMRAKLAEMSM